MRAIGAATRKSRRVLTTIAAAMLGWQCRGPSVDQAELARDIAIGTEWLVLKPARPLPAVRPRNELLLEVSGLSDDVCGPAIRLENGDTAEVEVILVNDKGKEAHLDDLHVVGFNGKYFVVGSSRPERSGDLGGRSRSVTRVQLKASRELTVKRVLWLSYDPRDLKSGIAFPK